MGCWGLVIYAATGAICSGKWSPGVEVRPRASCPFEQGHVSRRDRIMETRASSQGKAAGARLGTGSPETPVRPSSVRAPAGGLGGSDQRPAQVVAGLPELCH